MEKVTIDLLRSYTGQRLTKLMVGQVVQYDSKYWVVESVDLAMPFKLTPIILDHSRKQLKIVDE